MTRRSYTLWQYQPPYLHSLAFPVIRECLRPVSYIQHLVFREETGYAQRHGPCFLSWYTTQGFQHGYLPGFRLYD